MTRARNISRILSAQEITGDVNLSGFVTATGFFGDGAGITGLTAIGAGITVKDDGTVKGNAAFLDFGGNLDVSDINSGIATISVSGLTTSSVKTADLNVSGMTTLSSNLTVAGFSTFSGTTTISGNLSITGISTFTNTIDLDGHTEIDNLNVSGISTFTNIVDINGFADLTNVNVSGAITATTFTGNLSGNVNAPAQPSITSLGTLTSLDVNGHTDLDNVNVSGVSTFTGDVSFGSSITLGDNDRIRVGNNNDLDIYHDGSDSYIENDTGIFYIRTTGSSIEIDPAGGQAVKIASNQGTAELYANSSKKFETASTGVYITGIATASTHVDSGITTYYGDASYIAAGRWTLGADGTNNYIFTGPGLGHSTANDPDLYLKKGFTYMFENKMGAHPFRIQSTVNGSAGTQWNVGVTNNDVSNGVLIFEVPFSAPATLYYQCTAHANMGGVIYVS